MPQPPSKTPAASSDERTHGDTVNPTSETTPLLRRTSHVDDGDDVDGRAPIAVAAAPGPFKAGSADQPLPAAQITLLSFARIVEPIAFFSIFPYIAQMVKDNGNLPDSDIGFYSGLIESLFSATSMFVQIFWGRLADRIGRKPVLVICTFGMGIFVILFGFSKTLWQMILFRCLGGVFSGSLLTIRVMFTEHSNPGNQARAFSWFAFSNNLGIFVGPLIGGVLADPAGQHPKLFGNVQFFRDYPYALSGLGTGGLTLLAAIVCIFFVEETHKSKISKKVVNGQQNGSGGPGDQHHHSHQHQEDDASEDREMSLWEIMKLPNVPIVLWTYSFVMFLAFAYTAIIPIVLYTPVKLGGIGWKTLPISIFMAEEGAVQALWLLIAFPWLQYRLGTKKLLTWCGYFYPVVFVVGPVCNLLLQHNTKTATIWFWIIGGSLSVTAPGVAMAFTGVQLALNDVSPSSAVLGTLNAIALTLTSGVRAATPAAVTSLYAVGVGHQILGGLLFWAIFTPVSLIYLFSTFFLPDVGKPPIELERDDDE